MRASGPRWLVALAVLAVAVEAFETLGWWRWIGTVDALARDAEAGAARLADDPTLTLPPTLAWARQLAPRDLIEASDATVVRALRQLGAAQSRWLPTDFYGPTNLTRASLIEGDLAAAQTHLDDALRRHPTSPYLHRLTALVLRATGRPLESLDHLAQAEALAPGFRSPPLDLLAEDERWVLLEGLNRRLELYPRQRVTGLIELGRALHAAGELEPARQLLAEEGESPVVRLELAGWDLADSRFPQAAATAAAIAQHQTYPLQLRVPAWSILAQARDFQGDVAGARAAAQEALSLDPTSPSPYLTLASLAERRDDLKAAFEYLKTARGIDPGNVSILVRLASSAERVGSDGDARSALQRAAEIDAGSPATTSLLVDFLLRRGELMDGALILSAARERFPAEPQLLRQAEELRRRATAP